MDLPVPRINRMASRRSTDQSKLAAQRDSKDNGEAYGMNRSSDRAEAVDFENTAPIEIVGQPTESGSRHSFPRLAFARIYRTET